MPSSGATPMCPLHSSPRLSELMQRSPLPTILGSPSRVGAFIAAAALFWLVLIRSSLLRPFCPLSSPNPPVLPTWSPSWLSRVWCWARRAADPSQWSPPGPNSTPTIPPADGASSSRVLAGEALWHHGCCRAAQQQKWTCVSCFLLHACRSQSAGRLSDMLLKAAFGPGRGVGDTLSTGTPRPQSRHALPLPVQTLVLPCSAPWCRHRPVSRLQRPGSCGFYRRFSSEREHPPSGLQTQEVLR